MNNSSNKQPHGYIYSEYNSVEKLFLSRCITVNIMHEHPFLYVTDVVMKRCKSHLHSLNFKAIPLGGNLTNFSVFAKKNRITQQKVV